MYVHIYVYVYTYICHIYMIYIYIYIYLTYIIYIYDMYIRVCRHMEPFVEAPPQLRSADFGPNLGPRTG